MKYLTNMYCASFRYYNNIQESYKKNNPDKNAVKKGKNDINVYAYLVNKVQTITLCCQGWANSS